MTTDAKMLTVTEGNDQFYPTPPELAEQMIAGIDWDYIDSVLEPSAGKGDLIQALLNRNRHRGGYNSKPLRVDCIEIDPHLRGILDYTYGEGKRRKELSTEIHALEEKAELFGSEKTRLAALKSELSSLNAGRVHIVHDDFLTYNGYRRYSLILMNPPFADGERHLLKALDMQKRGGQVVCLLNAGTIRNPHTNWRRQLVQLLDKHEAKITFIQNAFRDAERRTGVEIALVKVSIPFERQESEIYSRMKAAKEAQINGSECRDLTTGDFLDQLLIDFQVEVESSLKLIQMYEDLKPHITKSFDAEGTWRDSAILTLTVEPDKNYLQKCDVNEYLREVRLKYWNHVFAQKEFIGQLTSELQAKWRGMVESMGDYDFTRFNIQQVLHEMRAEMVDGLKDTIMKLFDKLCGHSYYGPESGNVHYYDGWKTNKAHKVAKKVIVPCYGIVSEYTFSKVFDKHKALDMLSDLEKSFNYLDGGMTAEVNLEAVLDTALEENNRSKIRCKYFEVDIYKKGTVHIRFHPECMPLVEKLNIYAGRGKNWLPPNYGKAQYADMTAEEKRVVDSFQGKDAYAKVMAQRAYYLSEPARSVPALMPAT